MKLLLPALLIALAGGLAGCLEPTPEPALGEVSSALMQCSACSPATSCSTTCTDDDGMTDHCMSYECNSDPCSSVPATALESRRAEAGWSCTATLTALTIGSTTGYYRSCTQGRLVWSPNSCAEKMPAGTINTRYFGSASVRASVGFPMAAPDYGNANGIQRFEHGILATNINGLAAIVGGTAVPAAQRQALMTKWSQAIPGKFPAHDTIWLPGVGAYFKTIPYLGYDKLFTVKAGATSAHYVAGELENKYEAMGRWSSSLGWPTSDELCLDAPCRYAYSNFENGHLRWAAGPNRAVEATQIAGRIPSTPRQIVFDQALQKKTFAFRLSRELTASAGDLDADQDGLSDDAEKQLAFLTAPRIFWDEGEDASENQDFVKFRRLDMVQVRPRSANVSRWNPAHIQWITIRFMMEYPLQPGDHIGDSEMFEVRLFSAGPDFTEWRAGEIVFPPHGGTEGSTVYYPYYGDVGVLAQRAEYLGIAELWVAADENSHGSWGGSEIDSEECRGGGIVGHDCFDGDLEDALAAGKYWWFDPSRDIGEPEALRYNAWPLEARGSGTPVIPQIKREPNNPHAAYVENNTGHGIAREYILYRDDSPEIPSAIAFCGWKCPSRLPNGQCATPPYANGFGIGLVCDGGGVDFPTGPRTTTLYGSLFPSGQTYYRRGSDTTKPEYQAADFAYQLWGNANGQALTSGNVANRFQYPGVTITASSTYSAAYPASSIIDGDRRGTGWGQGGGWSSTSSPTAFVPEYLTIAFGQARSIRRIDLFTVQDGYTQPLEPTVALTFQYYGVRDYQLQYCPTATCTETTWQPIGAAVTSNDRVWRSHSFAAVTAHAIRVRINGAAAGNARVTELEAWE
ncbi:MAG TPA: discoidin domain-containing protein [Kofleriaceae bacterium]